MKRPTFWMPLAVVLLLPASAALSAAPDSYSKAWRSGAVTQRLQASIERHRKGDATLEVVDAAGKPLPGAKVELQQVGHEFLFGCNAFVLGQLSTPEMNQKYEQAFTRLFNFATVPLYWEGTEPVRGELRYAEGCRDMWRRPPADRYLPFAQRTGITLKGHPLLWHAYNASWLPKDADELRGLYQKRFREIAQRYGDKFSIFDVVNESLVCNKSYPLYTPDRAYVAWAFQQVAPLFPNQCTLMINEVTSFNFLPAEKNPYYAQVKELLTQGARVQGIGLQFHYFRRPHLDGYLAGGQCDPAKMLDLYEKFAEFNRPLYITEITIPSAGPDGEALQAEVVADHYRLWFSAPSMAGITWWNLGDGTAVKGENEAQGGLMDKNLDPKPAYRELDRLINEEWTTRAAAQADAQGQCTFRGFYGKYRVNVTAGGVTRSVEFMHAKSGPTSHRLEIKE